MDSPHSVSTLTHDELTRIAKEISPTALFVLRHVCPFPYAFSPTSSDLIRIDPRFLAPTEASFLRHDNVPEFPEVRGVLKSVFPLSPDAEYGDQRRKFVVQLEDDATDRVLDLALLDEWYVRQEVPEKGGIVSFQGERTLYRVLSVEECGGDEVVMTLTRWLEEKIPFHLPLQVHRSIHTLRAWMPCEMIGVLRKLNHLRFHAMQAYRLYRERGGEDDNTEILNPLHATHSEKDSLYRILRSTANPALFLKFLSQS